MDDDSSKRVCSCGCGECGESLLIEWAYTEELEYRLHALTTESLLLRSKWSKLEQLIRINGPHAVAIRNSVGDPDYSETSGFVIEDCNPCANPPLAAGVELSSVVISAWREAVRRDLVKRKARNDDSARARIRAKLGEIRKDED